MKNLLFKEFKLSIHPMVYIFMLFGIMLLIPNYPSCVFLIYVLVSFIFIFAVGKENRDVYYSLTLPVSKRDIVKARLMIVGGVEIGSLIISIPFAIISLLVLFQNGKGYGLEPTMAFYGLCLIAFAIFNIVFIPYFYKTANNILWGFLFGAVGASLFLILFEVLSSFSFLSIINDSTALLFQVLMFVFGVVVYAVTMYITYKISAKRFEKVNF